MPAQRAAGAHQLQVVGHHQAARPGPGVADAEELQAVDEGIDLRLCVALVEKHGEEPRRVGAQDAPVFVPGAALERRMQHPRHLGAALQPGGELARRGVLRAVAQRQRRQRAQHRLGVVARHAQAQVHVRELDALVQCVVARRHRTHQHVTAAARELGERLHDDVDAERAAVEGEAGTPGVVQRRQHAAVLRRGDEARQVRELHRHRAGRLQPDELGAFVQRRREARHVQRVVQAMRDAEPRQLVPRQLAARAVDVGGQQQLVAGGEQRQVHERDRRQPAGHELALPPALERGDALLEREGGGRAVQAVGVAGPAAPVACAHRRDVPEQHRRGLVDADLRRAEAGRWLVGMVDERAGSVGFQRRASVWAERVDGLFRSVARPGRAPRQRRCVHA